MFGDNICKSKCAHSIVDEHLYVDIVVTIIRLILFQNLISIRSVILKWARESEFFIVKIIIKEWKFYCHLFNKISHIVIMNTRIYL